MTFIMLLTREIRAKLCTPLHRTAKIQRQTGYLFTKIYNHIDSTYRSLNNKRSVCNVKTYLLIKPFYSEEEFLTEPSRLLTC